MPELSIPSTDPNIFIHLSTSLPIPRHRLIPRQEADAFVLGTKVTVIDHGALSENQRFSRVREVIASTNIVYQQSPDKSIYGMNVRAILNRWVGVRLTALGEDTPYPSPLS